MPRQKQKLKNSYDRDQIRIWKKKERFQWIINTAKKMEVSPDDDIESLKTRLKGILGVNCHTIQNTWEREIEKVLMDRLKEARSRK